MIHRITTLGEPRYPSPLSRFVSDDWFVPEHIIRGLPAPQQEWEFEMAGPRAKLFFDPTRTRAGIVTCGGLCPGLNNVIRSLFNELHHAYGVKEVLGFRDGFQGLDPAREQEPIVLTPEFVDDIHRHGGTVLGTSRGKVDQAAAVENLARLGVNILFTVGGDGTQRGGNELFQIARQRGHGLAVVGIPKTVDNDVAFVARTFGYLTAVQEAASVLDRAHAEARSVQNGIALVKVMGRHAGFIAVGATVASQEVNFCLIPEVPFKLDKFLAALKERLQKRAHAVIVVAEGVGQEWLGNRGAERDASGNVKLGDIGSFLRGQIEAYFKAEKIPIVMRYFDPSYHVRSGPANSEDSILCDLFARHAVHAAMAGKTGLVIGFLHDEFIHVPIELLASRRKSIDPAGPVWSGTLAATGQPERFAPEQLSYLNSHHQSNHQPTNTMIVTTAQLFKVAYGKFAIGAYNINNAEQTMGLFKGCLDSQAPFIIQISKGARKYTDKRMLEAIIRSAGQIFPEAVFAVHLDHGDEQTCYECIESGFFSSVMIDASHEPFDQNVAITKRVVDRAHAKGISVEAELGMLGGVEEDIKVEEGNACLTDPAEAERFVKQTGCDSLACAIGTSHGAFKFKGRQSLHFDVLQKIKTRLPGFPLVMHGSSSVPREEVDRINAAGGKIAGSMGVDPKEYLPAAKLGVTKVNIDTDGRLVWTRVHREFFRDKPAEFDFRPPGKIFIEEYARFIASRNQLLGSSGQLPTVRAAVSNSREETMLRAYHLWEQAGRPEGRDTEIWRKAEAQGRPTLDQEGCQG